jgi:hypothetical protein
MGEQAIEAALELGLPRVEAGAQVGWHWSGEGAMNECQPRSLISAFSDLPGVLTWCHQWCAVVVEAIRARHPSHK